MVVSRISLGPRFALTAVNGVGASGSGGRVARASSFTKQTIYDIGEGFRGKRVLIRCDFNGTVKNGQLVSTARIDAALETIKYVLDQGAARVILISHNGRYEELKDNKEQYSLRPAQAYLAGQLGEAVDFAAGFNFLISSDKRVVLAENTRFDARDEKHKDQAGSRAYAQEILNACRSNMYILDGFSVAHRAQASVTCLATLMKEAGKLAVAGHLLAKEYEFLVDRVINKPARPFLVFLGGAKVGGPNGKLPIIKALLPNVDCLVLGGAMAFPFLLERGHATEAMDPFGGRTGRAEELAAERAQAREILASSSGSKILVPDLLVDQNREMNANRIAEPEKTGADLVLKDIMLGELRGQLHSGQYRTIFFNGTFGAFEEELGGFVEGTYDVLSFMASQAGAVTVIGGGDTSTALKGFLKTPAGRQAGFTHATQGGGASGELLLLGLAGTPEKLPGFGCLSDRG